LKLLNLLDFSSSSSSSSIVVVVEDAASADDESISISADDHLLRFVHLVGSFYFFVSREKYQQPGMCAQIVLFNNSNFRANFGGVVVVVIYIYNNSILVTMFWCLFLWRATLMST
jgi:hypothetical protein